MIRAERRRLIARGEFPDSRGGIYNPGAVVENDVIMLLCRREVNYEFTTAVHPEIIVIDRQSLAVRSHRTLQKLGSHAGVRIEDFRLIDFNGQRLVTHTVVTASGIKPAISRITDAGLEPFDPFDLPLALNRVEKNWMLFEHESRLHCLYRLDPLTILVQSSRHRWELLKEEDNGWSARYPGLISNSANLIPFDGGYLGFWHTVVGGRYVQGALRLDRDLSIAAVTGVLLDGAEIRDGFKPGVLYVSSLVAQGDRILAFYGEADSHTGVAIFDADALASELRRSPFRAVRPLHVEYDGTTISDVFRAAHALKHFSAERGHPRIRLYIPDRAAPALHLLEAPNVTMRPLREGCWCDARLVGRTGRVEWTGREPSRHDGRMPPM